jgi:hypothetical protein
MEIMKKMKKNLIVFLKKIKNIKSINFMEIFNEKIIPYVDKWFQILVEVSPNLEINKEQFINRKYNSSNLKELIYGEDDFELIKEFREIKIKKDEKFGLFIKRFNLLKKYSTKTENFACEILKKSLPKILTEKILLKEFSLKDKEEKIERFETTESIFKFLKILDEELDEKIFYCSNKKLCNKCGSINHNSIDCIENLGFNDFNFKNKRYKKNDGNYQNKYQNNNYNESYDNQNKYQNNNQNNNYNKSYDNQNKYQNNNQNNNQNYIDIRI